MIAATCLKFENTTLDHEISNEEVYEAENGLVLDVPHSRAQKKEVVSL